MDLTGKTALVTGASSGIGTQFAWQLADRGANLILTARRELRLEALAHELRRDKQVKVEVVVADLATPTGAAELFSRTEGAGRRVDVLINNAGAGAYARFLELDWHTTQQQLQLNVISATELAYRFGQAMRERKQGWILNVASVAGYSPMPGYTTYAAGKTYVLNFSFALAQELRSSGVVVGCLSPGLTRSEFHLVAKHSLPSAAGMISMSAEDTAIRGLDGLFEGQANVIPGWFNKLGAFFLKLLPGRLGAAVTALVGPKDASRA